MNLGYEYRERIILEFARLAASFGDSHTELPLAQPGLGFHRFPLGLYFFGDDLHVVAADTAHRALLGSRLVAIGEEPIARVLDRLRPIVADDFGNPYELLHAGPGFLAIPEVLIGLEIVPPSEPVRYEFADAAGRRITARFTPLSFQEAAEAMTARIVGSDDGPLFARERARWYLFTYDTASHYLYVRINRSLDQAGSESLAAFSRRVVGVLAGGGVSRVVLDLRQNTGGNVHKTESLVDGICGAKRGGALSQVYVILGRHTYSAAILLAAQVKHDCGALFAGEVPRAVPNRPAEVERFRLPNSGLDVTYGAKRYRPFPELGDATTIPLDLPAPWTWESYRAGRDPALERVLARP